MEGTSHRREVNRKCQAKLRAKFKIRLEAMETELHEWRTGKRQFSNEPPVDDPPTKERRLTDPPEPPNSGCPQCAILFGTAVDLFHCCTDLHREKQDVAAEVLELAKHSHFITENASLKQELFNLRQQMTAESFICQTLHLFAG